MMLIKSRITKLAGLAVLCTSFSACDHDLDDDDSYHSGTADFSKFVSLGDSLTAGYADGALYLSGQENSFPNILAQQFAQVGGGDFIQPLMDDDLGGLLFGGNANPEFANRLVFNGETESPEIMAGTPSTEIISSALTGTFNNMGVPGAKSFHLVAPNYGDLAGLNTDPISANPYFTRFASSPAASMIEDAAIQQPSFFTLWVGNNDILSYATTGGTGMDLTGIEFITARDSTNDITDPALFASTYEGLLDAMTASGGKGVLINLPNISAIPFFTTVPFNVIEIEQDTADLLHAGFADKYNAGIQSLIGTLITEEEAAQRTLSFAEGYNAILIEDEDLTNLSDFEIPSIRQATADDLILLPTSSTIGTALDENNPTLFYGLSDPLVDGDVLIPSEILAIDTARQAYNTTIKNFADASEDLVLMDAAALLDSLPNGIDYGTGYVDETYATGGAFSLDGVHLTARGYAIIANEIMISIENGFGANLPAVDPGTFTTIFIK